MGMLCSHYAQRIWRRIWQCTPSDGTIQGWVLARWCAFAWSGSCSWLARHTSSTFSEILLVMISLCTLHRISGKRLTPGTRSTYHPDPRTGLRQRSPCYPCLLLTHTGRHASVCASRLEAREGERRKARDPSGMVLGCGGGARVASRSFIRVASKERERATNVLKSGVPGVLSGGWATYRPRSLPCPVPLSAARDLPHRIETACPRPS